MQTNLRDDLADQLRRAACACATSPATALACRVPSPCGSRETAARCHRRLARADPSRRPRCAFLSLAATAPARAMKQPALPHRAPAAWTAASRAPRGAQRARQQLRRHLHLGPCRLGLYPRRGRRCLRPDTGYDHGAASTIATGHATCCPATTSSTITPTTRPSIRTATHVAGLLAAPDNNYGMALALPRCECAHLQRLFGRYRGQLGQAMSISSRRLTARWPITAAS